MGIKDSKGLVGALVSILFLLVHFVSDFGGADVMGAQWLYVCVVDLVVLVYIIFNREILCFKYLRFSDLNVIINKYKQ